MIQFAFAAAFAVTIPQPVPAAHIETQAAGDVSINEILADNRATIADVFSEFDDYLELYNPGDSLLSLAGWFMSDVIDSVKWQLPPEAQVPAGGYLLLWMDGDTLQGPLHAPFGLSSNGETVYLWDGAMTLVDSLWFSIQYRDVAWGRRVDGGPVNGFLVPSPMAPNPDNAPPILTAVDQTPALPGPGDEAQITVTGFDLDGDPVTVTLVYDAGEGDVSTELPRFGFQWTGSIPAFPAGTAVSYYVSADDGRGGVWWQPALAPADRRDYRVTVGVPHVRINEFMADNLTTLMDDEGQFDDWIELVNVGNYDIDLSPYYLTDDLADPTKWSFPSGTIIPAGGRLIVWADNDPGFTQIHTNFKLSRTGESLGLFGPEYTGPEPIDTLSFGFQAPDVSWARVPDGFGAFGAASPATPLGNNGGGVVVVAAPDESPVEIPGTGGSFAFQASVFNRGTAPVTVDAWTVAVTGADAELRGLGPRTVTVRAESLLSTHLIQPVPGTLGPGSATYELRAGTYPNTVDASDGFTVTKLP